MDVNIQKYQAFLKAVGIWQFHKSCRSTLLLPVRDQPNDRRSGTGMEYDSSGTRQGWCPSDF